MCEFCHRHGEGKKWYLQAKNYSGDLLSDVRRRRTLKKFLSQPQETPTDGDQFQKLARLPGFVRGMIKARVTRHMKQVHFGQVLPLEDIEVIFGFVNSITRIPCICRKIKLGREARYCYGITLGPGPNALDEIFREINSGFDTSEFAESEQLSADQAVEAFSEHEKEGLCHSVWTFGTPFIGGICNCDRSDCFAMQSTVVHGVKVMFRAETVAEADPDLCTGCRSCMRHCQFGALGFSAADKKIFVDQTACYGCGVCRAACQKQAISLKPRAQVPAVAGVW